MLEKMQEQNEEKLFETIEKNVAMRSEFIRVICTMVAAVSLRAHIYCIFVAIKNIVRSMTHTHTHNGKLGQV